MAGIEFKADDLDSVINVIGLKPSDPLNSFGGKAGYDIASLSTVA